MLATRPEDTDVLMQQDSDVLSEHFYIMRTLT